MYKHISKHNLGKLVRLVTLLSVLGSILYLLCDSSHNCLTLMN